MGKKRYWLRKKRRSRRSGNSTVKAVRSYYRSACNWIHNYTDDGYHLPRLIFFECDPDRFWISSSGDRKMYDMGNYATMKLKKISWNFYGFHLFERKKYSPEIGAKLEVEEYWTEQFHEREIENFTLYYFHDYKNMCPRWIKEFMTADDRSADLHSNEALSFCKKIKVNKGKGHISGVHYPRCRITPAIGAQVPLEGTAGAYKPGWYHWSHFTNAYTCPGKDDDKSRSFRRFQKDFDALQIGANRPGGLASSTTPIFIDARTDPSYFSLRHYFTVDHPTGQIYRKPTIAKSGDGLKQFTEYLNEVYLIYNCCIKTTWHLQGKGDINWTDDCKQTTPISSKAFTFVG